MGSCVREVVGDSVTPTTVCVGGSVGDPEKRVEILGVPVVHSVASAVEVVVGEGDEVDRWFGEKVIPTLSDRVGVTVPLGLGITLVVRVARGVKEGDIEGVSVFVIIGEVEKLVLPVKDWFALSEG